jgi:hypothetical protein
MADRIRLRRARYTTDVFPSWWGTLKTEDEGKQKMVPKIIVMLFNLLRAEGLTPGHYWVEETRIPEDGIFETAHAWSREIWGEGSYGAPRKAFMAYREAEGWYYWEKGKTKTYLR